MAVRTARAAAKPGLLLDELDRLRLDQDWSYRQLAADMRRTGLAISAQTLHQVLTDRSITPFDRTLHKIRTYLDHRAAAPKAATPRRKRATA